jgi:hypothetical protein
MNLRSLNAAATRPRPIVLDMPPLRPSHGSGNLDGVETLPDGREMAEMVKETMPGAGATPGWLRRLIGIVGWRRDARPVAGAQREANTMTQPLTHMVAALQALIAQQAAIDRHEADEQERFRVPVWREANLLALDHLEQAMAAVAASEARDAVVQVLVAVGRLDGLREQTCERQMQEQLEVVRRLLHGALPALAAGVGVDLDACGGEHYGLSRRAAPFLGEDGGPTPPAD